MNKQQFLAELEEMISALPQEDKERSLAYYEEMIDDRIEEGMTEEQAVQELRSEEDLVAHILEDIPIQKLVRQKVKPSRSLSAWEIVLLVLGSPLWISLLLTVFFSALAIYISMWAVVLSLYAVVLCTAVAAVIGIGIGMAMIFIAGPTTGFMLVGAGLICIGLTILLFLGSNLLAKGVILLTKNILKGIKLCLIRKDNNK